MQRTLLTPTSVEQFHVGEATLGKIQFPDGTTVSEVRLTERDDPARVISDGEGQVLPEPGVGRYPYSDRIARIAVRHFNETGTLPF